MQTIQIDSDVFSILQKNAQPFIDTPNSTLRRLLGIDLVTPPAQLESHQGGDVLDQLLKESMERGRTKAPKADLSKLVRAGILKEGEQLFLVDYQNKIVAECEAKISGTSLLFKGKYCSMSKLAQELLKNVCGYNSKDVRGPSHWANASGNTITSLWEKYQSNATSGI
jgi:hypothetical protein